VQVNRVDYDSDLAILESPELDNQYAAAYAPAMSEVQADQQLSVYGYPESLEKMLRTTLQARAPAKTKLSDLLSNDLRGALTARGSPSLLLDVISIQGNLLPGHSGAPIFDKQGHVVAVAEGGLKDGTVAISFAIPISAIKNVRASATGDCFSLLVKNDSATRFDFVPAPDCTTCNIRTALLNAAEANDVETLNAFSRSISPRTTKTTLYLQRHDMALQMLYRQKDISRNHCTKASDVALRRIIEQ
jgi:hypothetical protein